MRSAALFIAAAMLLPVAGCGDGDDSSGGDSSSASEHILRPVRTFFVFDSSPDFNAYCRSYVEVHDQHTFRQGSSSDLAPDAHATETVCRNRSEVLYPNHTGYPDTQIGEVQEGKRKGRATVFLSYRIGGKSVPAKALVARIGAGDWRVLRGDYGD
jgi:hypothetical protein